MCWRGDQCTTIAFVVLRELFPCGVPYGRNIEGRDPGASISTNNLSVTSWPYLGAKSAASEFSCLLHGQNHMFFLEKFQCQIDFWPQLHLFGTTIHWPQQLTATSLFESSLRTGGVARELKFFSRSYGGSGPLGVEQWINGGSKVAL